jgi:phage terminase large subunit-like protein
MVPATDRFRTELQEGRLFHTGDETLTRHVLNTRLRRIGNTEGRSKFEKAGPGRLIDARVAAVLAVQASAVMPSEPAAPKQPPGAFSLADVPDDDDGNW